MKAKNLLVPPDGFLSTIQHTSDQQCVQLFLKAESLSMDMLTDGSDFGPAVIVDVPGADSKIAFPINAEQITQLIERLNFYKDVIQDFESDITKATA